MVILSAILGVWRIRVLWQVGKLGGQTERSPIRSLDRGAYTYDNTGRLIQTTYADGTSDGTVYDADGHRTTYTDRGGHTTSYAYDPAGRMTTTTYPDGSTSTSGYDSASRVISILDRNGNTTGYAYDDAGRRTAVTDALNNTTTFVYDNVGQQLSVTDARGNRVQYTYDADGQSDPGHLSRSEPLADRLRRPGPHDLQDRPSGRGHRLWL